MSISASVRYSLQFGATAGLAGPGAFLLFEGLDGGASTRAHCLLIAGGVFSAIALVGVCFRIEPSNEPTPEIHRAAASLVALLVTLAGAGGLFLMAHP